MLELLNHLINAGYPVEGISAAIGDEQESVVGEFLLILDSEGSEIRLDLSGKLTNDQKSEIEAIALKFIPSLPADYNQFRQDLYESDAWMRVLNSNPAIASAIGGVLWSLPTLKALPPQVKNLWNRAVASELLAPPISADEIESLNAIATKNHIPLHLDENGLISTGE